MAVPLPTANARAARSPVGIGLWIVQGSLERRKSGAQEALTLGGV
jgi:hypothetical protein